MMTRRLCRSPGGTSAELMTKVDFDKVSLQYEKVGDISVSDESAPMDAREALKVRATAVAYKKK